MSLWVLPVKAESPFLGFAMSPLAIPAKPGGSVFQEFSDPRLRGNRTILVENQILPASRTLSWERGYPARSSS